MKFLRHAYICSTLAALLLGSSTAVAADTRPASPVVEDAWIRMLPGDLPAAGYFGLRNRSDASRSLSGVESPAFAIAMLHKSSAQNGQSQMQHVDSAPLTPHGALRFAPGSYHLMLMGAKQPLTVGERVPITLSFSDGSRVTVEFVVRPAGASGP